MAKTNAKKELVDYNWLKSFSGLFTLLNPLIPIIELGLGNVFARRVVIDKSEGSAFIQCPHCQYNHSDLTWSLPNGAGSRNWFGLYCWNCGNIIPIIRNIFSSLILFVTYRFWFFLRENAKNVWLRNQPKRFKKLNFDENFHWHILCKIRSRLAWTLTVVWSVFIAMMAVFYPQLRTTDLALLIPLALPLLLCIYVAYSNNRQSIKYAEAFNGVNRQSN